MTEETKSKPSRKRRARRSATDVLQSYPEWFREVADIGTRPTKAEVAEQFRQASMLREQLRVEQGDTEHLCEAIQRQMGDVIQGLEGIFNAVSALLDAYNTSPAPPSATPSPAVAPAWPTGTLAEAPVATPDPNRGNPAGITEEDRDGWVQEALKKWGPALRPVVLKAVDKYVHHCQNIGEATSRPMAWIDDEIAKQSGNDLNLPDPGPDGWIDESEEAPSFPGTRQSVKLRQPNTDKSEE